jgi:hypothetical protein
LLQGLGELGECLCFDSHCCYLVRFAVLTVLDLSLMSGIHFDFSAFRYPARSDER